MVATKMLVGGRHKKSHHKKHVVHRRKASARHAKKAAPKVAVPKRPRYVKAGAKSVAKDPLRKCGKVIKSGKHKGMCKVVLSKKGQKLRAAQLARKGPKKSPKKSRK